MENCSNCGKKTSWLDFNIKEILCSDCLQKNKDAFTEQKIQLLSQSPIITFWAIPSVMLFSNKIIGNLSGDLFITENGIVYFSFERSKLKSEIDIYKSQQFNVNEDGPRTSLNVKNEFLYGVSIEERIKLCIGKFNSFVLAKSMIKNVTFDKTTNVKILVDNSDIAIDKIEKIRIQYDLFNDSNLEEIFLVVPINNSQKAVEYLIKWLKNEQIEKEDDQGSNLNLPQVKMLVKHIYEDKIEERTKISISKLSKSKTVDKYFSFFGDELIKCKNSMINTILETIKNTSTTTQDSLKKWVCTNRKKDIMFFVLIPLWLVWIFGPPIISIGLFFEDGFSIEDIYISTPLLIIGGLVSFALIKNIILKEVKLRLIYKNLFK